MISNDSRSWLRPCTEFPLAKGKPRNLLAILSGILIGTSYIPFPPWALFFCWIPLWLTWLSEERLDKAAAFRVFWTGWLTQFILTAIGFSWVSYTVHEFGHLPWPVALVVQVAYCAFANLYVPLVGLAWFVFVSKTQLSINRRIIALPILMNIGERVFPMIFDWHFGYTWLWAKFPGFQLADIFGFIGLSFFGLVINALLLSAYIRLKNRQSWKFNFVGAALFFAVLNVWGFVHGNHLEKPDSDLKVLVVQANVGNQEKLLAEKGAAYADTVLGRFSDLSAKGVNSAGEDSPDFVIWPETAFPELIEDPLLSYGFASQLKQVIQQSLHTKLITGGYSRLPLTGQITNSFFVLDDQGRWLGLPYHKTILLAFGEYFPAASLFPWLPEKFPEVGNFGRGPGPTVIPVGDFRIGAQICYEGLFDWFSRSLANKGAQVIVNLTNDSWYGKWQEPFQHGWMTLARAVEVRRPLIRSTNTGISTVILADGQILERSPLHKEWFYLYHVPYVKNPSKTAFMTWGYWFLPSLMALSLLGLLIRTKRKE